MPCLTNDMSWYLMPLEIYAPLKPYRASKVRTLDALDFCLDSMVSGIWRDFHWNIRWSEWCADKMYN